MPTVYRAMTASPDGYPRTGNTVRDLGVRSDGDFRDVIPDDEGNVHPDNGGMSVNPRVEDIPPWLGKRSPVWSFDTELLPRSLKYRQDKADHGLIEPGESMPLERYRETLAETREDWGLA